MKNFYQKLIEILSSRMKLLFLFLLFVIFFLGILLGSWIEDFFSLKQISKIPSSLMQIAKKILNYSFKLSFPPAPSSIPSSPPLPFPTPTSSLSPPQDSNSFCPSQEETIIKVVKETSPAVVSIIISKTVPIFKKHYEEPFKEYKEFFGDDFFFEFKIPRYVPEGEQKKEIGGGTGFIISQDGLILTNKHVVKDTKAEYKVITNEGKKYDARVLAHDPFQDLAVLKIEGKDSLPVVVKLGNSSSVQIGQTVIAIGNALGEFRNTVSVGVISGLGRTITAFGEGVIETLEDVIQTDAAINRGNSGGPLLNLKGEVIGINVAIAEGAQGIGFAIPIDKAKRAIEQIKKIGKIIYPFLGIRYILITPEIQEEKKLKVNEGALVIRGEKNEPAILPGSAAEKAGLKEGDIILEINNEKVSLKNSLAKLIQKYNPGEKIKLKVLRKEKTLELIAILDEKSS